MGKRNHILVLLLGAALVLSACKNPNKNNKNRNKDPFYVKDAGFDYVRFPLIKPYEVMSLDRLKSWNIRGGPESKTIADINNIYGIKKINIIGNNIVICYCEDDPIIAGEKYPNAWFVILTDKLVTKGFTKEEDFIEYLKQQGIEKEQIQWSTPKELFKQFSDTYCLPWIPGCEQ